jgi:riboflavin synthase
MFTGIIEAVGTVQAKQAQSGDLKVTIATGALDLADVKLGDSIAVNGVCLTVVELTGSGFIADISNETVNYTRWSDISIGEAVNLEKAMMPTSRLGGHIVSGHVDGIAQIVDRQEDARSIRFKVAAPDTLARYIAHKGSITIDGVSLTVNAVNGSVFDINIVPHTAKETTLYGFQAGKKVHIEVDVIARYLERLISGQKDSGKQNNVQSNISEGFLAEHGFV